MTCLGFFYQFLYPVQEFKLKIDILKNGTFRICLYGRVPPPPGIELDLLRVLRFEVLDITVDSDILPSPDMPASVLESLNLELHCCNFENLDFAKFFFKFQISKMVSNIWTLQTILRNIEFCKTKV